MFHLSPFDQMFNVFRDVDALFRRTLADAARFDGPAALPGTPSRALTTTSSGQAGDWTGSFLPSVESFTREDRLVLRAELPGVEPSAIEVSLVGDMLTLRGEKKLQRQEEQDRLHLQETVHGRFERSFRIPEGVNPDDVKASYQNGVLEITLPAPAAVKTHHIPVIGSDDPKQIKAA